MQAFVQPGQDQQSDDIAGKKEVRAQKIKKSVKGCSPFSERQNIVRFIDNHVEIYTLLDIYYSLLEIGYSVASNKLQRKGILLCECVTLN